MRQGWLACNIRQFTLSCAARFKAYPPSVTEIEKLVCELIVLPSVNPAFLPPNHPDAGEGRVADFLAATAAQAGLDVELREVLPGRSNVLARLTPAGAVRHRVLLAPHMDTVGAFSPGQFSPRLRQGRIYGRGSCDTKGSIASMLGALTALAQSPARPTATEIIFAGLIDEESAQAGSRALAASGLKADLAVVGEPTRLRVVTAHKGSLWLHLETRGKAAHGACPELGRNAVHEMARIVDFLQTDYALELKQRRHLLLGCATVSVGSIKGGTQANIVPARCEASVDRRTLPGETERSVRGELQRLFRRHKLRALIGDEKPCPCHPMETGAELPLVRKFMQAARQTKPAGVNYFCDASVLAHAGIPSIVFGPGDIAQAHTAEEWIGLKSLANATACLLKFFRSLP
jgi:acetylornithine deacetylase/succinyl-diaminopimelate desuccinylase-like protein